MIIIGIETSCDETSAALLEVRRGVFSVLSHVVSSSVKEQAKYGGIVPEVAARKQMEYIIPVLQEALGNKQLTTSDKRLGKKKSSVVSRQSSVDVVAVTVGPGLATSLQVGIDAAKALAYVLQKPIVPVNHLEGHLYSPLLSTEGERSKGQGTRGRLRFPVIGLVVSGGHTELVLVKDYLTYKLIGRTRDDAAGEAFDKVAKLLGLGYPGGPILSKLAEKGDPGTYDFPRGMIGSGDFDFSFSGLKTAVLYATKKKKNMKTKKQLPHVAASFQQAVVDVLVTKTLSAVKVYNAKTVLLGGGVAANPLLRESLVRECQEFGIECQVSPLVYTGDNAAMIALTGYFRYKDGGYVKPDPQLRQWQRIVAQPNMKLV